MKVFLNGMVIVVGMLAGVSGASGAGTIASASPSSVIAVQDGDGGGDGAGVDSDGTQGDYKAAMDGSESGPLMVAAPQTHASR